MLFVWQSWRGVGGKQRRFGSASFGLSLTRYTVWIDMMSSRLLTALVRRYWLMVSKCLSVGVTFRRPEVFGFEAWLRNTGGQEVCGMLRRQSIIFLPRSDRGARGPSRQQHPERCTGDTRREAHTSAMPQEWTRSVRLEYFSSSDSVHAQYPDNLSVHRRLLKTPATHPQIHAWHHVNIPPIPWPTTGTPTSDLGVFHVHATSHRGHVMGGNHQSR